jgi:large conductance mechanosensitive channel
LNYGKFIQTAIDFTIIAFAIFVAVKGINVLKRKEEAKPPEKQAVNEVAILSEIRDILKERR